MPSQRTLRDYTNCVKAAAGFSTEVDILLMQAANVAACKDWQKLVVLLLDEMHVKEDLVYNKHSGQMIGFIHLGDINDHLMAFENAVRGEENDDDSMMVIMVRGVFTKLCFPYAQWPCKKITGALLFGLFWNTVCRLERMGLKVQ